MKSLRLLLVVLCLGGCAHRPDTTLEQEQRIDALAQELRQIAPEAPAPRARELAALAVNTSADLGRQYGVRLTPWLHNIEVNSGTRPRGLCFHYARDLDSVLRPQAGPYWQIHKIQAHPKAVREHNALAISRAGARWDSGIVLDGWRHNGVLYFGPVSTDRYPWQPVKYRQPAAGAPAQSLSTSQSSLSRSELSSAVP